MPTTAPIATFEDILTALEQSPPLRAALRKYVLDQEFQKLPAEVRELRQTVSELAQTVRDNNAAAEARLDRLDSQIAELAQVVRDYVAASGARLERLEIGQAELKTDVAELKTDVAELKVGQARLVERTDKMSGRINKMSGQINNMSGSDYERRAKKASRRMIGRKMGIRRATVLRFKKRDLDEFEREFLQPALRKNIIDEDQAVQLEEADIILRFTAPDGQMTYVAAEVSITVHDKDRRRATQRAEIIGKATGDDARPFVIGQRQQKLGAGVPDVPFIEYIPQ